MGPALAADNVVSDIKGATIVAAPLYLAGFFYFVPCIDPGAKS
jgi:hypothetical protein